MQILYGDKYNSQVCEPSAEIRSEHSESTVDRRSAELSVTHQSKTCEGVDDVDVDVDDDDAQHTKAHNGAERSARR